MKLVVQRVSKASVKVKGEVVATIGMGLLILVGISKEDKEEIVEKMAQKLLKLRIFPDSQKGINCSIEDIKGAILLVPQFTLLADTSEGNRPSFIKAAKPELAQKLFNLLVEKLKQSQLSIETGIFREYMEVELVNDGPVTIIY